MLLEKLGAVGVFSAIKASGLLAFVVPAIALRALGAREVRVPLVGHDLPSAGESEAVRRILTATAGPAARILAFHDAARIGIDEAERSISELRSDLAGIAIAR